MSWRSYLFLVLVNGGGMDGSTVLLRLLVERRLLANPSRGVRFFLYLRSIKYPAPNTLAMNEEKTN